MASTGLNSLISNTGVQQTTLPTWYDTAQQNVVNQATAANTAAPTPQNTVAQNAVNALSGPTNAFTQAGGSLQSIASGAANPWNTDASGQVTPNTNTALGGLFQAQDQQLNQLLPQTLAPVEAGNIGSGNFGSLRGQTALDTARGAAQANLLSSQMQAALQNQTTGVNAGAAAGNVAQQNINNLLTTGQYQQASPYTNAANLGNVLSSIQAPQTVSNQTQLSPLNQVMGVASALGGNSVLTSGLFGSGSPAVGTPGQPGYKAAVPAGPLASLYNSLFNSSSTNPTGPISTNISGSGQTTQAIDTSGGNYGAPVSGNNGSGGAGAGQVLGTDGQIYNDPSYGSGSTNTTATSDFTDPNSGVTTSQDPASADYSSGV